MRKILLLPIALLSICCCSQKPANVSNVKITSQTCPDDGDCAVELLQNQALDVKTDNFGATYHQLTANPNTSVIRFSYTRHVDPQLADAGYREEVMFEINNDVQEFKFSGPDLQQVKALYGRLCFCRGQTGYYPIQDGTLSVTKKGKQYEIVMDYSITQVPQIVKHFSMTAK